MILYIRKKNIRFTPITSRNIALTRESSCKERSLHQKQSIKFSLNFKIFTVKTRCNPEHVLLCIRKTPILHLIVGTASERGRIDAKKYYFINFVYLFSFLFSNRIRAMAVGRTKQTHFQLLHKNYLNCLLSQILLARMSEYKNQNVQKFTINRCSLSWQGVERLENHIFL